MYVQDHIAILLLFYLFLLFLVFFSMFMMAFKCKDYFSRGKELSTRNRIPLSFYFLSIVWTGLFLLISLTSTIQILFLVLVVIIGFIGYGFNSLTFWGNMVSNIYHSTKDSKCNGLFTLLSFYIPIFVLYCLHFNVPQLELSIMGFTLVYILPLFSIFWKNHFYPFPKLLPEFSVNTKVICLACIAIGHIINCTIPERSLITDSFYNIVSFTFQDHQYHNMIIMILSNSALFIFGYFAIAYEDDCPEAVYKNVVISGCFASFVIQGITIPALTEFIYITPWYGSYKFITRKYQYLGVVDTLKNKHELKFGIYINI